MTTTPFLFLLAFLSGICFYTGLHFLLMGWRRPTNWTNLSFASMCIGVGLFVSAEIFGYAALTSDQLVWWRRLDWALALLVFMSLTWFITLFTGWRERWIPKLLTGCLIGLIGADFILPFGIGYPGKPLLDRYALPWGEVVTDIGMHSKTVWFYASWAAVLSVFIYLFVACKRMYQRGQRAGARILMFSAGAFLLFVLSNQLVNYNLVRFVYLAPFGFIAMIIMMGIYLSWEHQRVNKLLQDSESRYAAIIASSVDGIIITDAQQRIQVFNAAAEHLFGYRANEITGKPIDCLFAEGPRWGYQQNLRDIAAPAANFQSLQRFGRIRGLRANGREFPLDASFSQVTMYGQQFVSAIVRDASESQKDKQTARLSADRYHTLLTNIPGMVYRIGVVSPWMMQFISEGVLDITGYRATQFYGKDAVQWLERVLPEDRRVIDAAYMELLSLKQSLDISYRIRHQDNSIRWVRDRARLVCDNQGKPLYIDGLALDITARRKAEEELASTNLRLEAAVQQRTQELTRIIQRFNEAQRVANIGSWELDLITQVPTWSGEIYRILELDPQQVSASYDVFLDLVHPNDRASVKKAYADSIDNHTLYEQIHRVVMPDGRIKYLHGRAITEYDPQGKPLHSLGTTQDITVRIEAEQQLRRQAQVIDQIHDSVVATDLQGNVTSWNNGAAQLFGYRADEMLGQPISRVYPADQQQILLNEVIAPLQQQGQLEKEVIMMRRNGERFYAHLSVSMLYDEQGEAYGMIGYAIDITVSKNFEQTLQRVNADLEARVRDRTRELDEARQFNAAVVATIGALVVVMDRAGQIILFNHACELTSGYFTEEVLGKCVWDFLLVPQEREPVKQVFAGLTAGDFPSEYENHWMHRSGALRRIAWSNTCLTDANGKVEFVIATGMDITERVRTEEALRSSEELFRQLTENIREVFFVRDIDENRMIYVSPAFENLFDLSRERLYQSARAFIERVHPDDLAGVKTALHAQENQQQYFNHEYRIVPRPGEVRWVWVRTFPVRDNTGKVYRLAGLVEDITERRTVEESRLAHARAQRDLLVREVHHRIKNNLQGIVGLLRQHVSAQPAIKPAVDSAINQVSAMALVHGLQGKAHAEQINLCDLTEAIAASIAGLTGLHVAPIVNRITQVPVVIVADEAVPVALIVNELLFNAVKHAPLDAQTPIRIQIDCHDRMIHLTIHSHGKPLPAGFDLQRGRGIGTGLMLVKSLLPEHCHVDIQGIGNEIQTVLKLAPPVVVIPDGCN